jgi:hypothetical protein
LFACHGLFGAMHQSGPVPTVIGEHPSQADLPAEQQGSEAPDEGFVQAHQDLLQQEGVVVGVVVPPSPDRAASRSKSSRTISVLCVPSMAGARVCGEVSVRASIGARAENWEVCSGGAIERSAARAFSYKLLLDQAIEELYPLLSRRSRRPVLGSGSQYGAPVCFYSSPPTSKVPGQDKKGRARYLRSGPG